MRVPDPHAFAVDPALDVAFMNIALDLGRRMLGAAWPNPAVGALVVREDGAGPVIVGRGWTAAGGRPHAETEALRRAGAAARGATLYVTLEPCSHVGRTPPCADAVIAAGIARVVSALEDPDPRVAGRGHSRLAGHGIPVSLGVGREQALIAHSGHIRRIRDGRPHVTLKLAVSADGRIGLPGGRPVQITSGPARDRVHLMRAEADAILVGIGTVLSDDPALTCRLPGMEARSPVRVVLDTALRLPDTSRLVATAREVPVWVFAAEDASTEREHALRAAGVEVVRLARAARGLDPLEAIRWLGRLGITRLMVEGGARVARSFVEADLVDEAAILTAPAALGPDAVDALAGLPLSTALAALVPAGAEDLGPDRLAVFRRA